VTTEKPTVPREIGQQSEHSERGDEHDETDHDEDDLLNLLGELEHGAVARRGDVAVEGQAEDQREHDDRHHRRRRHRPEDVRRDEVGQGLLPADDVRCRLLQCRIELAVEGHARSGPDHDAEHPSECRGDDGEPENPAERARHQGASPRPATDPVATITDDITRGTIAIWISRMKMSPTNLTLLAQSPTARPNRTPVIAPIAICVAGLFNTFMIPLLADDGRFGVRATPRET